MVVLAVNWGLVRSVAQVTHKVDTGLVNYVWLVTDHAISATVPLATCFISFFCLQPLHFHKCVYIICNRLPSFVENRPIYIAVYTIQDLCHRGICAKVYYLQFQFLKRITNKVFFCNQLFILKILNLTMYFVGWGLYLLCWCERHVFTEFGCI